MKQTRKKHGDEFKSEALKLANQVGAAQAARYLGVKPYCISIAILTLGFIFY